MQATPRKPSQSRGRGAAIALRRRYFLSFLSLPLIDLGFALIFELPLSGFLVGAILFLSVAAFFGWQLYRPVDHYLRWHETVPFPESAVANLARNSIVLLSVLIGFQTTANFFLIPVLVVADATTALSPAQLAGLPLLRWAYFTAVVYFVMGDFARALRLELHTTWQRTVHPRPRRLTVRLLVGFELTSVVPLGLVLIDTLDVQAEIRAFRQHKPPFR